jgi:hypothetical protein
MKYILHEYLKRLCSLTFMALLHVQSHWISSDSFRSVSVIDYCSHSAGNAHALLTEYSVIRVMKPSGLVMLSYNENNAYVSYSFATYILLSYYNYNMSFFKEYS